jgi:RNA polymerase sigma-70 factor, ECF subfamily
MEPLNFEKLVEETGAQIRAYIAGMGVPIDDVDDLAQEVYLSFYKSKEKLPPDVLPIRWLKGVAKNTCMNHFRKARRRSDKHLEVIAELLSQVEETQEQPNSDHQSKALQRCIQELNEKNQKLISLRYVEGHPTEAVAKLMELTDAAVRVMLFRVRGVLKNCVETKARGVS